MLYVKCECDAEIVKCFTAQSNHLFIFIDFDVFRFQQKNAFQIENTIHNRTREKGER